MTDYRTPIRCRDTIETAAPGEPEVVDAIIASMTREREPGAIREVPA